jgi:addiction module HigA family antidote
MGLTQAALAEAMGVQRKHVNELCNDRRNVTAATALILARVFGNSPDFWLNVQRRNDLWEAMNSPRERERIGRKDRREDQGQTPRSVCGLSAGPNSLRTGNLTGKEKNSGVRMVRLWHGLAGAWLASASAASSPGA